MKLVGLSRGGEESSSVHGGELRNVRDWEILKDEQVLAVEGRDMCMCFHVERFHGILSISNMSIDIYTEVNTNWYTVLLIGIISFNG